MTVNWAGSASVSLPCWDEGRTEEEEELRGRREGGDGELGRAERVDGGSEVIIVASEGNRVRPM